MRMAPTAPTSPRAMKKAPKKAGMQVVMDEGYSVTSPDLSSLVTKLKRARPDVILHTGYNPDISLFLRQARELGLRFDALIGHGAGYTDYNKIKSTVGNDANYFFDVDPISIWETNPKALRPELPPLIQMVGDAYMKAEARHGDQVGACRHGGVQHLPVPVRRAAARDHEIWRHFRRRVGQGSNGHRPARRRHHAGLRREVRRPGAGDVRAERSRVPRGDPIHRRQKLCGVAEVAAAARARAEAASQSRPTRRSDRCSVLEVAGSDQAFRWLHRRRPTCRSRSIRARFLA